MNQDSALPTRKVGSGALAGAAVTIIVWILSLFGVDMPAEVAAAITAILMFAAGYFVKDEALPPPPTEPPV